MAHEPAGWSEKGWMEMEYNITTVIPARAGSKRLPGKNTRDLCGRPMVEYTIEAAQKSVHIKGMNVVVTSDDSAVLNVARDMAVPYVRKRPENLCTDAASQVDVITDAVGWLGEMGIPTDTVMLLQPTSPLRTGKDIDAAIERYVMSNAKTMVSVSECQEYPYDVVDESGKMVMQPNKCLYFFINGAIYLSNYNHLLTRRTFLIPSETLFYIMPKDRGIDVDDEQDFAVAEKILKGGL